MASRVARFHANCACGKGWDSLVQAHCSVCHEHFTNARAFDLHRQGGVDSRRCDTQGLEKNAAGTWGRPGDLRSDSMPPGNGNGQSG